MTLLELHAAISGLSATLQREHERAKHREEIIDRLHEENQVLRRGELQQMYEPVRATLYRLYDQVRRAQGAPPTADHVVPLLKMIGDEIVEALGRTGLDRFSALAGEPYDPARHRPLGAEPVTDPALDGAVAVACADGFARAGKDGAEQIVRRAEVRVGRLVTES